MFFLFFYYFILHSPALHAAVRTGKKSRQGDKPSKEPARGKDQDVSKEERARPARASPEARRQSTGKDSRKRSKEIA
jgi:hypothetical protein